jgi:uncharacterized membrane protein YgdD (TMEM256/DUF423 family)
LTRLALTLGAIYGLLAVALGAFGAHGLAVRVPAERLATWSTGADYLGLHALALLAVGALLALRPDARLLVLAAVCLAAGALVFSGSLFVLVLSGERWWGGVTPFGGLTLIAGWALLAIGVWRAFGARRD